MFHPQSDAARPFESCGTRTSTPAVRGRPPQLPAFVEPITDEALLSWLSRLAARLGLSPQTLARESFGIKDQLRHSKWRARPHPWLLARMSHRSGVSVAQLRRMTFIDWAPVYRNDEASERFSGRRLEPALRTRVPTRFAVCGQCLRQDAHPYIRLQWLIGWVAVCPVHAVTLITRCPACSNPLRIPKLMITTHVSASHCLHCGACVTSGESAPAHDAVLKVQDTLLAAKRYGEIQIKGIGLLCWPEIVSLLDAWLAIIWKPGEANAREHLQWQIADELQLPSIRSADFSDGRYGSLALIAWLLKDWPHSSNARIGKDLLSRSLAFQRLQRRHDSKPAEAQEDTLIRERLTQLLSATGGRTG